MDSSLFAFIWKHSKRDQLFLLALTIITFPFLFATLELPKRIINDAIGAATNSITLIGVEYSQLQFLWVLCFGYLAAVIAHGLLKMRLNTMKGITAERLLRRFRFQLLSRMHRFPRSYFRTTSQGELVSMITSEAEPMGGLMGDMVAQPVFQAGQMLIIVMFLFLQSVWFGLAGIALIPLQAWIIPMLQRRINLLNKERIKEVRAFSAEIGESAAGITDLRTNGGVRYRMAQFTNRLSRLFEIRFQIFQKKFFMKFLNNFITQLTPFFFYSVGGWLAIRGDITVGALVAALAAYKDLSSPWKELLTYYNQTQDMGLRWQVVTEKFEPNGALDESLFDAPPDVMPHLFGDIILKEVTVRDGDGTAILENVSLNIPKGARVAIEAKNQSERVAFSELLAREVVPTRGSITIAGQDILTLHQSVLAGRVGYAHSQPHLFEGALRDTLMMPLRVRPKREDDKNDRFSDEAERSGNSADRLDDRWIEPSLAGLETEDEVRQWWFELITAMGLDDFIFRRMMDGIIDPDAYPELAQAVVTLRPEIHSALQEAGLDAYVNRFDPEAFNPSVPLGGNLMFAAPRRAVTQDELVSDEGFLGMMSQHGLAEKGIAISKTVIETLRQTFGKDGTDHPLFTALGIDEGTYERLIRIAALSSEKGDAALTDQEFALLLTVPFTLSAEQIGPAFPDSFKDEIVALRKENGAVLREQVQHLFIPIGPATFLPRSTVLQNAIYGRISMVAGAKADEIAAIVGQVLSKHGLRRAVSQTIFDMRIGAGGGGMANIFLERLAFVRAAIKRPDIMIMDRVLASYDETLRQRAVDALGDLLPDTTLIVLDETISHPENFDLVVELHDGRIDGVQRSDEDTDADDLSNKLRAIARTELFANISTRNQRLLAFAAQWYKAPKGHRVFEMGEPPDAAYLCVSGKALLSYHGVDGKERTVSEVTPGRLIGDLSIIINEDRQLHLTALEDSVFLRIGAPEFRAVLENDTGVLLNLLQTVAGHLTNAAEIIRKSNLAIDQVDTEENSMVPDAPER